MEQVLTGVGDRAAANAEKAVRTVALASLIGTTVEWYDFFLYGTVTGLVFNKLFFPSGDAFVATALAYTVYAVGFATRPLGGGRRRIAFDDRLEELAREARMPRIELVDRVEIEFVGALLGAICFGGDTSRVRRLGVGDAREVAGRVRKEGTSCDERPARSALCRGIRSDPVRSQPAPDRRGAGRRSGRHHAAQLPARPLLSRQLAGGRSRQCGSSVTCAGSGWGNG